MFFKKKRMESLKIQDVSAECPSYTEEKAAGEAGRMDGTSESKTQKPKRQKKSRMRKIRQKRRKPFAVVLVFLLIVVAGAAGFYFFGIPFLLGNSEL